MKLFDKFDWGVIIVAAIAVIIFVTFTVEKLQ
jgi:hypothetical protein